MEQYIIQLLEDMLAAQRKESVEGVNTYGEGIDDFEAHIAEVEHYLSGEGHQPLGQIIGMFPEQFPPADRLNPSQIEQVVKGFNDLLFSYNITVDVPNNFPIVKHYQLLMTVFNKEVFVADSGFTHLEFCSYDEKSCPFGEKFCSCKDLEIDDMDNFKYKDDGELPF